MRGILQDLLARQADAIEAPSIDLERIIADGNRRIRRRRGFTAAGVAAAAAAVVTIAWSIVRVDTSADPADAPFHDRRPTYAIGDVIHYGRSVIDVPGHVINSFVQTDAGFVLTTKAGDVFFADGNDVERVGTGDLTHRLAADDTGSLVGWMDLNMYVVYDVEARREVLRTDLAGKNRPAPGTADLPFVAAIDDGKAYLVASDGLHRWDLASHADELIAPGAGADWLHDVAAGRMVFDLRPPIPGGSKVVVNSDPRANAPYFFGWTGNLSPAAAYVVTQSRDRTPPLVVGERTLVFDVGSSREITLRHPGYEGLVTGQWLDDDRFTAWSVIDTHDPESAMHADLLVCWISSGSCTVQARNIGTLTAGADPGLRLPDGHPWEGGG
jgi:hypothetical protein